MKNKSKKAVLLLFGVFLIGNFLVGCAIEEQTPREISLPKMDVLQGNVLELMHDVEGFKFKTFYNSEDYKFDRWRITDSKNIKMKAIVEGLEEGAEVLIEHVHVDISLKSTSPQLDGLTQDSMDDTYHGFSQDGFLVTGKYPYENIFAIEGFSKDIMEGWNFYCGEYGSGSINSSRLSEETLVRDGTYANKLTVVYDLLIKNKGEDKYHTRCIVDEILIPLPTVQIREENLNN